MAADLASRFLSDLAATLASVVVTDRAGRDLGRDAGLASAISMFEGCRAAGNRVYFIGNGGSAAIASHQAVDFWKIGGLDATAFNDSSLLTAVGNDDGFENVFARPLESRARPGDLVVGISSSGRSPDILKGAEAARGRGARVLTLSGFDPSNPLRRLGDLNFHAPRSSYGLVEIAHLSLLHAVLDAMVASRRPA